MVNLAQILTLDKTRLKRRLGQLPPDSLAAVNTALRISLALN